MVAAASLLAGYLVIFPPSTRSDTGYRVSAVAGLKGDADEDGFRGEGYTVGGADTADDLAREGEKVSRRRVARVDKGKCVLGRDARRARGTVALGEACVLDQPGGRDLDQAPARGIAGHRARSLTCRGRLDAGEFLGGDHRVGEEGAGAAGIRVAGIEDHALTGADLNNGGADLAGPCLLTHV